MSSQTREAGPGFTQKSIIGTVILIGAACGMSGCGNFGSDREPLLFDLSGEIAPVPSEGRDVLPEPRGAGLTVFVSESPLGKSPIADANVNLIPIGGGAHRQAVSDQGGVCFFGNISPGEYALSVNHDAFPPNRGVITFSGGRRMAVMLLNSDSHVTGRVFAADTKDPVKEFEVYVPGDGASLSPRWRDGFVPFQTEDGEFDAVGVGEIARIVIRAPGFAPYVLQIPSESRQNRRKLEFPLDRSPIVIGTIVNQEGKPVSDARIRPLDSQIGAFLGEIETDEEGKYRIDSLVRTPALFAAEHDDYAPSRVEIPLCNPGESVSVRTVLGPGVQISGRVVLDGNGVADTPVKLRHKQFGNRYSTDTNEAGEFRFSRVPAGRFRLETTLQPGSVPSIPRGAPERIATKDFEAEENEHRQESLELTLQGAMVDGFVTFDDKPAIATLHAGFTFADTWNIVRSSTDDGGWYQLTGLQKGECIVTIEAAEPTSIRYVSIPGSRGATQMEADTIRRHYAFTVQDGDYAQQDFDMRRGGTVIGTIERENGDVSLVAASVRFMETESGNPAQVEPEIVQVSDDGTFTIGGLPPGTYRVQSAVARDRRSWNKALLGSPHDVRIEGEEEIKVDLDLPPAPAPS